VSALTFTRRNDSDRRLRCRCPCDLSSGHEAKQNGERWRTESVSPGGGGIWISALSVLRSAGKSKSVRSVGTDLLLLLCERQRHRIRRVKAQIVALYIAWLIAAGMLVATVVGPPSFAVGLASRVLDHSHTLRSSSVHRRGNYSPRKDFYTLLRWVCCAAFAYSAFTAFQMKRASWTWVFGILAVLFNPFGIVHLQQATWQVIDWAAIGVIVVGAVVFWRDKGTSKAQAK